MQIGTRSHQPRHCLLSSPSTLAPYPLANVSRPLLLCGGTFLDSPAGITPGMRRRQTPKWQETDPQFPKSRWWLADGKFVGFRIVCEP
jgi:hypothetical protein